MKLQLYWSYATRSLRRGGQRTLLAIFCIGVGVMAIVALQLASLMVANDLTGNVREANGGDISVRQAIIPFQQRELAYFAGLQARGRVTTQTAVTDDEGIVHAGTRSYPVSIAAVDPAAYPLVGQPDFLQPAHGDLHRLLAAPGAAVLSSAVADQLRLSLGDQVALNGANGHTMTVRVVGLVRGGGLIGTGAGLYVQRAAYAASSASPLTYGVVYLTTASDTQATAVAAEIKARYPLATVQTVADALKASQASTALIHQLLQVVGILSLLIGGFGVVNTMNVLLARRRGEIAMLKTSGYQRGDLYALFGLEATVLGLVGGVFGSLLGIGLSWGVKTLLENAFGLHLAFVVDPGAVLMGVVVGLATAIIFGLQPIVRAAAVRPLAILRDLPEQQSRGRHWRTRLGSMLLFLLLSVLFCALASIILGSVPWGLAVVYGMFVVLGVLSLIFGLLVWLIGALPVPERPGWRQALLTTGGLLVALAIYAVVPSVGGLLVVVALFGYVVAFLPSAWKLTLKIALRNIGRQRTRATMTLLALFVGVFSIGLMLVLGQNIQSKLDTALASQSAYNVLSLVPARWASEVEGRLAHLPGLQKRSVVVGARTIPVAVNGRPLVGLLKTIPANGGANNLGVAGTLAYLSGVAGYDVARGQATDTTIAPGNGRDLTAADAGTANVLMNANLHTLGPLHLQLGDRIMMLNPASPTTSLVITVVGFYTAGLVNLRLASVLAARGLVQSFAGADVQVGYSLQVAPAQVATAVAQLDSSAPHALTLNVASLGSIVDQILGNLITLLVALAALALFAGVVIIANAVGLAMLERRREQGILKAVGYTSERVLASVLVENGVISGMGAVLGMLLVSLATAVLARTFFKTSLDIPGLTALGLIGLIVVIALVVSTLVSWSAVRVRPLDVLRYE